MSLNLPPVYPNRNHSNRNDTNLFSRVGSYVSRDDFLTINSAAGQSGVISHIIDHAIHSVAEHIRATGYTPVVDSTRFLDWIRQRPVGEPTPPAQGQPGDDTGRTPSPRQPASDVENKSSGAGKTTPRRRSGGGKQTGT